MEFGSKVFTFIVAVCVISAGLYTGRLFDVFALLTVPLAILGALFCPAWVLNAGRNESVAQWRAIFALAPTPLAFWATFGTWHAAFAGFAVMMPLAWLLFLRGYFVHLPRQRRQESEADRPYSGAWDNGSSSSDSSRFSGAGGSFAGAGAAGVWAANSTEKNSESSSNDSSGCDSGGGEGGGA